MILSSEQRFALLRIVNAVEDGDTAPPRMTGEVGRFLHEFGVLRARVRELVPHEGQFVRGRTIGPTGLTPLAPLSERIKSELLGEVASTIALSEELAGVVNVTLWAKARSANHLRNVWLRGAKAVRIVGDFRWFAPRRLTPGSASVEELAQTTSPWGARCLKFVAHEFLAAPAAASYRWDAAFGPPDFRTFRVSVLHASSAGWVIVPGTEQRLSHSANVCWADADVGRHAAGSDLFLAMLVRDPWTERWEVVDAEPVDADGALAHLITWADHTRELIGLSSPTALEVTAMQRIVESLGYTTTRSEGLRRANLTRAVAPSIRHMAAWVRGLE